MLEIYSYMNTLQYKSINSIGFSLGGCKLLYQIAKQKTGIISNAMTINSPLDMYASVNQCCPFGNWQIGKIQKQRQITNLEYIRDTIVNHRKRGVGNQAPTTLHHVNSNNELSLHEIKSSILKSNSLHELSESISSYIFEIDGMQFKNVYEY